MTWLGVDQAEVPKALKLGYHISNYTEEEGEQACSWPQKKCWQRDKIISIDVGNYYSSLKPK